MCFSSQQTGETKGGDEIAKTHTDVSFLLTRCLHNRTDKKGEE